jgi:hypothetical protein
MCDKVLLKLTFPNGCLLLRYSNPTPDFAHLVSQAEIWSNTSYQYGELDLRFFTMLNKFHIALTKNEQIQVLNHHLTTYTYEN